MTAPPPPDPELTALVNAGLAALQAGDRRRARDLLTEATRRDPRHEAAWLALSAAHDDPAFKRIGLNKVLALNPRHAEARRQLAELDGQPARPPSIFARPAPPGPADRPAAPPAATMRARPREPIIPRCPWCQAEIPRSLSDRCPRCGRPLEFDCPACEQAVPLDHKACPRCDRPLGAFADDRLGYLSRLGEAYRARGWVDQDLRVAELLVELAPEAAGHHLRLAQLYGQLGETERAVNAYRQVLDRDPQNAAALAELGHWYLTLRQTPELREIAGRLRGRRQRSVRLSLLLADIDYELEHVRNAERGYRELARRRDLDPRARAHVHLRLGEALMARGQTSHARREFQASAAAGVDTEMSRAAAAWLERLRPSLPDHALSHYGETARAMAGPVLLVWILAALQAGFQVARLTLAGAVGMVLAVLGTYLLACAWVTPLTREWRELLGAGGLLHPGARFMVTVLGGGLLAAAVILVFAGM